LIPYISNSQRIRADSARMDWSKAVQASSVQVQKNWGLVRSRSKNYSDWIGLDLDGPGPDWSIAGLVESLCQAGCAKDKVQTMISTDVIISATIRCPPSATHHMPHAARQTLSTIRHLPHASRAWLLQLRKSLDRACRSVHGNI
jgi:hypothetical protein